MSLPEISRRCLSCGAAVRAGGRFCPQCGQKMAAGPGAGDEAVPPPAGAAPADEAQSRGGAGSAFAEWGGAVRPESGGRAADAADASAILGSGSAREWAPPTKEFAAFVGSSEDVPARPSEDGAIGPAKNDAVESSEDGEAHAVEEVKAVETPAAAVEAGASSAGEGRGRVARVREETRARVGRMKDEALVVFEEAPDDSGLRFVLTAAALFVVFLVILLLSTTLLR